MTSIKGRAEQAQKKKEKEGFKSIDEKEYPLIATDVLEIEKVNYSEHELWDIIINTGAKTDVAKQFLSTAIEDKREMRKVICGRVLTALIENKHIDVSKTLLDEMWCIEHLYKIRDKDGEVITFKLNKAQKIFMRFKWYRNIILKSRQLGFSTLALILNWHWAFWNPYQNNLIIAHKLDDAKKLFRRIEFIYNSMPKFLKDLVYLKSKTTEQIEIGFDTKYNPDGSKIELAKQPGKVLSTISVSTSGRSDALSSGHISELAYIDRHHPEKSEEIQRGTIPALPNNGKLTIESTSQGNIGLFAKTYRESTTTPISNKEFKKFFFNWTWSDYDLLQVTQNEIDNILRWDFDEADEFREYQKKYNLSDRQIACYYSFFKSLGSDWDALRREYPTTEEEALMNVDDLVFPGAKLDEMNPRAGRENGKWVFYKEPIMGHRYAIGADVGAGQGGDPSAATVLDLETNEEVAVFEDKMTEPDMFAYELAQYGKYYNTAYIAPERNNVGVGVIAKLKEIYPDQQIHKETRTGTRIDRRTNKYGWMTTGNTKPKMVADLKTAIIQDEIIINSARTIEQLRGYSREEIIVNNKMSVKYGDKVKNGAHFDRVDSLMIAWQVRADALLFSFRKTGTNKMQELIAKRKGQSLS